MVVKSAAMRSSLALRRLGPLFALCAACSPGDAIEWQRIVVAGSITTWEEYENNTLEVGEEIRPNCNGVTVTMKPSCTGDIYIQWTICWVSKIGTEEAIAMNLNGDPVCGSFRTDFECGDSELGKGSTRCTGDLYCSITIISPETSRLEGWEIARGTVYGADGTLIEQLSPWDIAKIGHELLPGKPSAP